MTQRDFFRLISKLFGLYFILQIIPAILASLAFILTGSTNIISLLLFFATIVIATVFIQLLIFTPDKIVDKILSKPIEHQANFIQTTIWYSCIILGFYLVINSINPFLEALRFSYAPSFSVFYNDINYQPIFVNCLKIIIGFLLIILSKSIASFLLKKNKVITCDNEEKSDSIH